MQDGRNSTKFGIAARWNHLLTAAKKQVYFWEMQQFYSLEWTVKIYGRAAAQLWGLTEKERQDIQAGLKEA